MPNAKVLSEKQAIVAALTEKLQNAAAGVIVDYKGITVAEDTALRADCRENNVEYAVIKNTLLRFAFNNVGLNELDDQLNGTTSLAVCMDDPVAPARVIADYAKKLNGKFEIKGGFMEGKVVSLETVNALASIPALPVLQAPGSGHHAYPHLCSGLRAEADCREGRRSRRGSRRRVNSGTTRASPPHPNQTNILQSGGFIKMSEKITAMIEEIKGLTVLELSELVHALEEEFGVSAAAMAAPAAGAAAPAAEEKTEFDVVLTGFDAAQKIKVIKVVREVMGLGLAEAKAAVEGAPTTMKEGLSKEDAEALKKQVEEVGGKVELK